MQPIEEELLESSLDVDYLPGVLGHVIVASGPDEEGREAVALWQVGPAGKPDGAWIFSSAREDPAAASRLVGLARQRALVAWDVSTEAGLLEHLAQIADVTGGTWRDTYVSLPDALVEVIQWREKLIAEFETYRAGTASKVEPLKWPHRAPAGVTSMTELAGTGRVVRPAAPSQVAAGVLHLAMLTRWVAGLWQETEQARMRRPFLRQRYGPSMPLPPSWLASLRAAYRSGDRDCRAARPSFGKGAPCTR